MTTTGARSVLPLVVLLLVARADRAATQDAPDTSSRKVALVSRAEAPLTIDGALDDPAWQMAMPLTNFVQADPLEGEAPTEQTEVRLLFDDEALYVGVINYDSDPTQIVTTDTRRDSSLGDQDSFQVIFDTYNDAQNGFVFGTNPLGVEYDAQVRSQDNPTTSWDGSWEVKTRVLEDTWTAEFRIPLRTLRYGPAPQTWGVNFARNIQRKREKSFWSPLPRQYDLNRLTSAGEMRGLQLETPRNFKVMPYVVGSADRTYSPQSTPVDANGDVGFDAKFGVTPSLNLDATYNTDFAQVEVDTQQINLTRFNIRFPEKRPFFLENSGLFRVGKGNELDLFFSRRIGLDNDGGIVPIKGGGRLSGKVANGVNVGVLNMQTDDTGATPGSNFTVGRVNRELRNRSSVGAIFVNRNATGRLARTDDWNRTFGTDARVGIGESFNLSGFAARTQTPGLRGREYAWNVDSDYDNGVHQLSFEHGVTGEAFNPEVGYREIGVGENYRRTFVRVQEVMRQTRIRGWGFREFLPHASYTRYDYLEGGLNTADLHVDNHWDWENGNFVTVALNGTWDGIVTPFVVYPGVIVPPGEHGGLRMTLRANSDRRKWLYGRLQWDKGRFLTGDQSSPTVQVVIRDGGRFAVDGTWNYRWITLPQGSFHTNLGNMRVTYNFSPSVFVQSLLQYNDRTDRWSTNLRFHWLETAGTGFFAVFNNTEALGGLGPVNRAFILKYVRQFDILR